VRGRVCKGLDHGPARSWCGRVAATKLPIPSCAAVLLIRTPDGPTGRHDPAGRQL